MYGDYVLRIELWFEKIPDVRNSPRIIEILKEHNLLHSGLSGTVDFAENKRQPVIFRIYDSKQRSHRPSDHRY